MTVSRDQIRKCDSCYDRINAETMDSMREDLAKNHWEDSANISFTSGHVWGNCLAILQGPRLSPIGHILVKAQPRAG